VSVSTNAPASHIACTQGIFADPLNSRTGTWVLSTSNVSSPWLDWFAFGPQCDKGFGLGYSIADEGVPVVVTCNKASRYVALCALHCGVDPLGITVCPCLSLHLSCLSLCASVRLSRAGPHHRV
jgi:hypothetical protein